MSVFNLEYNSAAGSRTLPYWATVDKNTQLQVRTAKKIAFGHQGMLLRSVRLSFARSSQIATATGLSLER